MASANDATVVRVFTNEPTENFADLAFAINADFEVTVEAEAGLALLQGGNQFNTNVVVQDITANNNIAANPANGFSGQLGQAAWPNANQSFKYTVPKANLNGRANHVCQVLAWLTVGNNNQNVSFVSSPPFILTNP